MTALLDTRSPATTARMTALPVAPVTAKGWHDDPSARHDLRYHDGSEELYDVAADPRELHDLARAGSPEIPRLRRAWTDLQGGSGAPQGACRAEVNSELLSAGLARLGAYRWERRLPRSARWMSQSTSRLTTADRSPRGAGS